MEMLTWAEREDPLAVVGFYYYLRLFGNAQYLSEKVTNVANGTSVVTKLPAEKLLFFLFFFFKLHQSNLPLSCFVN